MMRALALSLLLPSLALAQGIQPSPDPALDLFARPALWGGKRPAPLLPAGSGTCHAWWYQGGIRDSRSCAWTMAGNVPQASWRTSPFRSALGAGAGPFTGSNYYSTPIAGVLDLGNTVNATVEVVWKAGTIGATDALVATKGGGSTVRGLDFYMLADGSLYCRVADGTAFARASRPAGTLVAGTTYHLACTVSWAAGVATVNVYSNGTVGTPSSNTVSNATGAVPVKVGSETYGSTSGTIYEVVITRGTALSGAQLTVNAALVAAQLR